MKASEFVLLENKKMKAPDKAPEDLRAALRSKNPQVANQELVKMGRARVMMVHLAIRPGCREQAREAKAQTLPARVPLITEKRLSGCSGTKLWILL